MSEIDFQPIAMEDKGGGTYSANVGFSPLSPEDLTELKLQKAYGDGLANEAKAFGEGVLRGASFGASDYLLPKIPGGPTQEALKERSNRNPVSNYLGQGAGVLGSALIPGGGAVGAATKLGGITERAIAPVISNAIANKAASNIISKVGAKALGSVVEGSLFGAGQVASEAALGDPDLTAGKAFSQIGLSGLIAGTFGGLLKGGQMALPKAVEKAISSSVHEEIAEAGSLFKSSKLFGDDFLSKLKKSKHAAINADIDKIKEMVSAEAIKSAETQAPSNLAESILKNVVKKGSSRAAAYGIGHMLGVPTPVISGAITAIEIAKDAGLKIEVLKKLEKMVQKTTNQIIKGADTVFEVANHSPATPFLGSIGTKEILNEQYAKATDTVNDLSDFDSFTNQIDEATKPIHQHVPQVTGHLQMAAAGAVNFLQSKIPRAPIQTPLSPPFVPSEAQKARFVNYWNVVNSPLTALNQVKKGNLTKDTVEALQMVHPKLYQEMKSVLTGKLMDVKGSGKTIPYQTRAMITQFFQEPMDQSFMPASIQSTQALYLGPSRNAQGSMGRNSKSTLGGLGKLDVANRAMLPTQRVRLGGRKL